MIDLAYIKNNELIVFESTSGSKAYGLDGYYSANDIRGVFVLPKSAFFK